MATVKITSDGIIGAVFVDGVKVPDVRGYSLEHNAGKLPVLKLDMLASEITFDGDGFVPALPEMFRPFYRFDTTEEIATHITAPQEQPNPGIDAKELSVALQQARKNRL